MTRRDLFLLALGFGGTLFGCATLRRRAGVPTKKLVEFGWGEPDTAFMRRHVAQMEETPFDGVVFHVNYTTPGGKQASFLWEAWGRRAFTEAELATALQDLAATRFRRFTDNFLRFNTSPGDVDWFDDFSAVVANARLAARVAREGQVAGILFDAEQYQFPLFDYRRQRHTGAKTWEAYATQARRRGREVMEAFQDGFPDLTVFLTFGYGVPWLEMQHGAPSLEACEYGLLVPFLDGMVDAANGCTRLVDGYEPAYFHNKNLEKFAAAYRMLTEDLLPIVAQPERYRRLLSVGFGLFMDYDPQKRPWNGVDGSANYYAPPEFEASVRAALDVADEYVWIYTEAPRWWSAAGTPVDLPAGYADALRRVRRDLGL
ncbi:MAG: hypothetical protein EHM71_17685 [Zetaproteobacteria bacterium]|nr:MAG: hypothetical protein EHM71_17685 [Zetaproteobacteria bacterium]